MCLMLAAAGGLCAVTPVCGSGGPNQGAVHREQTRREMLLLLPNKTNQHCLLLNFSAWHYQQERCFSFLSLSLSHTLFLCFSLSHSVHMCYACVCVCVCVCVCACVCVYVLCLCVCVYICVMPVWVLCAHPICLSVFYFTVRVGFVQHRDACTQITNSTTHKHTCIRTFTLSLSHTHTHTHTLSLFLTHTNTHIHSLCL